MAWAIINIVISLLAAMSGAYLLGGYGHRFNWVERGGIALQAGAAILRIGPILSRDVIKSSPFDDWSGALFAFGGAMAMCGIIARLEGFSPAARLAVEPGEGRIGKWRHRKRNERAVAEAERYMAERGKI